MTAYPAAFALALAAPGTEFHVAANGDDARVGASAQPIRAIQHAADRAQGEVRLKVW